MTLTERILKELENGPATAGEIASALSDKPVKLVQNMLWNLSNASPKRAVVVGEKPRVGVVGRPKEKIYGLPGTRMLSRPKESPERAKSPPIANGEYALALPRRAPRLRWPSKNQGGLA